MAGESPDRSKQQQSSGETTPSERDPRVAVFGKDDGPGAASGSAPERGTLANGSAAGPVNGSAKGSSSPGASASVNGSDEDAGADRAAEGDPAPVDQATAVFRAPRQADHESRDTRLRAAVAAWVATDDDPEAPEADGPAESGSGSGTGTSTGAGAGAGAAKATSAGKPVGADAEGDEEAAPARESAPASKAAPAPEEAPAPDAAEDAPETPEADTKADADADADAAPVSRDGKAADKGTREGADASAPAASEVSEAADGPEAEPAVEPAAEPKPKTGAESQAESMEQPKTGAKSAAADSKPEAEPRSGAKSDASGAKSDAESRSGAKSGAAGAEPVATEPTPDGDEPAPRGRATSWGAKPSTTDAAAGAAAAAGAGVDQPTAVFKAVKPPVVDQPTTAIRRPGGKADSAAGPAAEAPAERSSTFVPLRSDDVRPAGPKAAPDAEPEAGAAKAAAPAAAKPPVSPRISVPDADAAERTRQQPLPPKPPLDLLAELTNTPPPAQTPVRTAVRRFKIWTPLVILLLIVFAVVQYVRPLPDAQLTMTSAPEFTFDGAAPQLPWPSEGQGMITVSGLGTVGRFGEEKPVPIASVTKSMTAYIIMRDHPMKVGSKGASIRVDDLAEKEGGYNKAGKDESTVDTIKAGQSLSQKDALSAVMIPSANNVARLLARWDAGSEAAFVKKMNDTAKQLGMTNTTYTDPSGLTATTVSTAADQVKLATELVKDPALVEITRQPYWYDSTGRKWLNYNKLVPFNGAIGIKTGSTSKAGGNLLFAAVKEVGGTKQTIVGAVFGQHKAISILDLVNKVSKDVLLATRKSLTSQTVIKKGDVVGYVDDGLGGKDPVVATKDLTVAGWPSLKVAISLTPDGGKVPHSAKAGTVVGKLTVGSGTGQVSAPVALKKDLAEPGFGAKLTRLG
ncbi:MULTISPECIES: D-alanyl-D-alanine carboxypeptidase [unclassified Streptomyces]|uniref:D-alanyl-D-alanine carboxypeptidase n=1 Tax=unclassified Streptomyces TaxID=2593676 RepID=UPI0033D9DEF4